MEVTTKSIGSRAPHCRTAENSARHGLHGLPSEATHVVTERVAWCHAGELDGGEGKRTVSQPRRGGVLDYKFELLRTIHTGIVAVAEWYSFLIPTGY